MSKPLCRVTLSFDPQVYERMRAIAGDRGLSRYLQNLFLQQIEGQNHFGKLMDKINTLHQATTTVEMLFKAMYDVAKERVQMMKETNTNQQEDQ